MIEFDPLTEENPLDCYDIANSMDFRREDMKKTHLVGIRAGSDKVHTLLTNEISKGESVVLRHEPATYGNRHYPNCINCYLEESGKIVGSIPEADKDPAHMQHLILAFMDEKGTKELPAFITGVTYHEVIDEGLATAIREYVKKPDASMLKVIVSQMKSLKKSTEYASQVVSEDLVTVVSSIQVGIGDMYQSAAVTKASIEYTDNLKAQESFREKDGKKYERITSFLDRNDHLILSLGDIKGMKSWRDNIGEKAGKMVLAVTAQEGNVLHELAGALRHVWGSLTDTQRSRIGKAINLDDGSMVSSVLEPSYSKPSSERVNPEEHQVFDEELNLSGQADFMYWDNDCLVVADDKRSTFATKGGAKNHIKRKLQISFYATNLARMNKAKEVRADIYFWNMSREENAVLDVIRLTNEDIKKYYSMLKQVVNGESISGAT